MSTPDTGAKAYRVFYNNICLFKLTLAIAININDVIQLSNGKEYIVKDLKGETILEQIK